MVVQVSHFINDPNNYRVSTTQITDAFNRTQSQFVLDSLALYKDDTITTVSGIAAYDLPTDFMFEKLVELKGIGLKPISRATLDYYNTSDRWDDDAGTPEYFMINPEEAKKTITLFPIPQSGDAGSDNMILTYYPFPSTLVYAEQTDILNGSALMVQFHMGLCAYAAWLLLMNEDMTESIQSKRRDLKKMYDDAVSDAISKFGDTVSEPIMMKGGRYFK